VYADCKRKVEIVKNLNAFLDGRIRSEGSDSAELGLPINRHV